MTLAELDNSAALAWLVLSGCALIYAMFLAAKSWRMFWRFAIGIIIIGIIVNIFRAYA